MKLKYFSLIFAIIGILSLFFISTLSKPIVIELFEIPEHEGKQITTEGIVTNYYSTKYGNQIITIEKDQVKAIVFTEEETTVEYGDKIRVTGKVQRYNNEWEIIVDDKRHIEIIKKWHNISMPLWQLVQKPERYVDLNVNITGYIDSIYDDYFYLVDEDNKHSLLVFYNNYDATSLFPGQKVIITGVFKFDEENFRYSLKLYDRTHRILPAAGS